MAKKSSDLIVNKDFRNLLTSTFQSKYMEQLKDRNIIDKEIPQFRMSKKAERNARQYMRCEMKRIAEEIIDNIPTFVKGEKKGVFKGSTLPNDLFKESTKITKDGEF